MRREVLIREAKPQRSVIYCVAIKRSIAAIAIAPPKAELRRPRPYVSETHVIEYGYPHKWP
jgi:hypothetical protein